MVLHQSLSHADRVTAPFTQGSLWALPRQVSYWEMLRVAALRADDIRPYAVVGKIPKDMSNAH